MSGLFIPRNSRQPALGAQLRTPPNFARHLRALVVPNQAGDYEREHVTGLLIPKNTYGTRVAGQFGYGMAVAAPGGAAWKAVIPESMKLQAPLTLVALVDVYGDSTTVGATADNPRVFGIQHNEIDSSPYVSVQFYRGVVGTPDANKFRIGINNGAFTEIIGFNPGVGRCFLAFRLSTTGYREFFINGVLAGSGGGGTVTIQYHSTSVLCMGDPAGTYSRQPGCSVLLGALFNKWLDDGEMRSLMCDPFQLLTR